MEITNGHAARMRFARFKNQMEGTVPKTRAPRDKSRPPKAKRVKTKAEKKEDGGIAEDDSREAKERLKLKVEEVAGVGSGVGVGDGATRDERGESARSATPLIKPEPVDELVLLADADADADAPGEAVHESEFPQHVAPRMMTPNTSQDSHCSPHQQPQQHLLTPPQHQHQHHALPHSHESPYNFSHHSQQQQQQQRRASLSFSTVASPSSEPNFSFSHDLLSPGIFMHSIDGSSDPQDLHIESASANGGCGGGGGDNFFHPYLYETPPPHQQQQVLVDGISGFTKGEGEWEGSFC